MNKTPPKLLFGPYQAPSVQIGETVICAIRGPVVVKTFTDARIPQPVKAGQGAGIIVCGDLVMALRSESASAVAYWWGISVHAVSRWRVALGLNRYNEGTRALLAENGNREIHKHAASGAAAMNADPDTKARRAKSHSVSMRLKPLEALQLAALASPEIEREIMSQFFDSDEIAPSPVVTAASRHHSKGKK